MTISSKKALVLIDLQKDFCPGGSLAVPRGDEVMAVANRLQPHFERVVASKDWHPEEHISFFSSHPDHRRGELFMVDQLPQELWPDHCVQGTAGAEFHPQLNTTSIHKVVYKGIELNIDSYSAFFDNHHKRSTGLGEYLRLEGVEVVYIMGLTTDYCVKYSCKDALKLGFKVYLIEDGCRGVNLKPGDTALALEELRAAGVHVIQSADLI